MKKILLLGATATLFFAFTNSKNEDTTIELGKSYGPVKVDTTDALTVQEMLTQFNANKDQSIFTFKSELSGVCLTAGCWVSIDKGNGETFMVRFKDHFTIPTKTKIGTSAYIHGRAHIDTVSVEMLKHFAEDAGKSKDEIAKITEPTFEMGFEADGITLVK